MKSAGTRPHSRRYLRQLVRLVGALCLAVGTSAVRGEPTEADVKAAFAFNFLRFVEWPQAALAGPPAPLVVGVSGAPEIRERLEILAEGELVRGHPVEVRAVRPGESPAGLHVLYLGVAAGAPGLPAASRAKGLLTVSDAPGFAREGGIIGLVVVNQRVRFEINRGAARRASLQLSAQLLSLATVVAEPAPQP